MLHKIKILAIAATLALAAPVALADSWMSYGTFEPDVVEDADAGWMWDGPPTGDNQVYFNVYGGTSGPTTLTMPTNVNVGALETRFYSAQQSFLALLGVWKDCNGDGYIGLAETAAHSYRVELGLHDENVCPLTPTEPSHNDGAWIRELIPITNGLGTNLFDEVAAHTITDGTAMVWGDAGFPGQAFGEDGGGGCWIRPQPRGTFSTTGGLNQAVDCRANHGDTYNEAVLTADPENSLGLALANKDDWKEQGHPLNVVLLGEEDAAGSAAQVWDCSGEPIVAEEIADPTAEGESFTVTVYNVNVQPGSGTSFRGTFNETTAGLGGCDTENNGGYWWLIEGNVVNDGNTNKGKIQADINFRSWSQTFSFLANDELEGPHDLGIAQLQAAHGTYWTSFTSYVNSAPDVPVRAGLSTDTSSPGAEPQLGAAPTYWSFYAYVNAAALGAGGLTLPGGGATAAYGHEWCDGATSGIPFGFNCDADSWNIDSEGPVDKEVDQVKLAAVHDLYNLRDIDCYDSSFAGAPYPSTCAQPLPTPAKDE